MMQATELMMFADIELDTCRKARMWKYEAWQILLTCLFGVKCHAKTLLFQQVAPAMLTLKIGSRCLSLQLLAKHIGSSCV